MSTSVQQVNAQSESVRWMDFEALEVALTKETKKVFVDFVTEWCVYCKKMDRVVFRDPEVIRELNANYYCVRMNAESQDSIKFGGRTFINREVGLKRNPTHELPLLLGSREDHPFTLPVIIILNERFEVVERYFQYISPEQMKTILKI